MPTYDYNCKSCGYIFEEFQSITADPLVVCPRCAQPSLKRILAGGSGMIFKGSGFYLTDYKRSGGDGSAGKPKGSKASDTKASSSGTTKEGTSSD